MKTMVCGSVNDPDWQQAKQQYQFAVTATESGRYEYGDFDPEKHLLALVADKPNGQVGICWLHYELAQQRLGILRRLDCILDNWESISGDAETYCFGLWDTEYWYEAEHFSRRSTGQWQLKKQFRFSLMEELQGGIKW